MNAPKQCKDRFDDVVAYVMGELEPAAGRELQEHIARCDECRRAHGVLMDEEQRVRSGFEAMARSLRPVEQTVLGADCRPQLRGGALNHHFLEGVKNMIRAHKRLSVAAAVAATALAAGVILCVSLVSSPTAAYALEQTVEANKQVTSYHAKITPAAALGEIWVELKADGTPLRARWDLQSPDDGAKVVVFSEGKIEIWFKDKKSHGFLPEKDGFKMVMQARSLFDPKLAFEEIQAAKTKGKAQIEMKEPANQGDPITLTVTSKHQPNRRQVYEVDPTTKLVKRVTHYRRQGDQWKQVELVEYLDYNKEIDPKVFRLNLPKDVVTIDQINRKPGLVKGDLTEEEMATRVAREFFEALIANDYDKAGLIYEGMPADKMKELLGKYKFLRIIEIGKPVWGKHPDKHAVQVPVKVEWEAKGKREVHEFTPYVRPAYNQPDRRVICGGV